MSSPSFIATEQQETTAKKPIGEVLEQISGYPSAFHKTWLTDWFAAANTIPECAS